jgi:hypothetical protein
MTTAATLSLHVLNAIVQLLSHTSLHVLHVIKDDPQASAVLTDREQAQQQQQTLPAAEFTAAAAKAQ